jgi:hypothetical protein
MVRRFRSGFIAAAVSAALFAAPYVAHACAMCGLSPGDHEIHAFNASVLFMLSAPYAIVAVIGGVLGGAYFMARRKGRTNVAALAQRPSTLRGAILKRLGVAE